MAAPVLRPGRPLPVGYDLRSGEYGPLAGTFQLARRWTGDATKLRLQCDGPRPARAPGPIVLGRRRMSRVAPQRGQAQRPGQDLPWLEPERRCSAVQSPCRHASHARSAIPCCRGAIRRLFVGTTLLSCAGAVSCVPRCLALGTVRQRQTHDFVAAKIPAEKPVRAVVTRLGLHAALDQIPHPLRHGAADPTWSTPQSFRRHQPVTPSPPGGRPVRRAAVQDPCPSRPAGGSPAPGPPSPL